jgi:DNA polymerase-3 subunit epsilon
MMDTGWAAGPMATFDVESTGVDVQTARIVTACVATVNTTPPVEPRTWLADPGVEIPAEATAVHGITTAFARQNGRTPQEVLAEIRAALVEAWDAGRPVVVFNAPYDISVLDRELHRHGLTPLPAIGPVIDPLVLDRHADRYRRGPRTLDALCAHYAIHRDGAHDATQDALAAARVAWRIAQRHPHLAAMDLQDLFALQVRARSTWAQEFETYLRSQGRHEVIDRSWPIRQETASG